MRITILYIKKISSGTRPCIFFNRRNRLKRYLRAVICWLLITQTAYSQNYQRTADSLRGLLNKAAHDTDRILLLSRLSGVYNYIDPPDQRFKLARQALQLSSKQASPYYVGLAYYRLANAYHSVFSMDSALKYSLLSAGAFGSDTTPRAKKMYAYAMINQALIYDNSGIPEKSADVLISLLPVFQSLKDTLAYFTAIHNLGAALITQKQYTKAHDYLLKEISLAEQMGNNEDAKTEIAFLNGALLMYYMDDPGRMQAYLDRAKQNLKNRGKSPLESRYYSYLALYNIKTQKYMLAQNAITEAFAIAKKFEDRQCLYDAYDAQQQLASAQKEYTAAREAAHMLYEMGTEDALPSYIGVSLKSMADYSKQLGDLKRAYLYLEKYTVFKDSIDKKQTAFKIAEAEIRYQSAEKQNQITLLQKQKVQAELEIRNKRLYNWLLGVGCLLFMIAALASIILFRKNKKIVQQQLHDARQQHTLNLTKAMLEGEERERQRVARDLHDGLGGMLAGVKINLSKQSKMENQNLDRAIDQLDQSVSELRRIARNMMPESLLKFGLEAALSDLCESFSNPATSIEFQAYAIKTDMSAGTQANIYRIVQEILSNAIRHAQASEIIVQCSQNDHIFLITAEDNGSGFDTAKLDTFSGIGFANIKSRVAYLSGRMDIHSVINEGTTINIELYVG